MLYVLYLNYSRLQQAPPRNKECSIFVAFFYPRQTSRIDLSIFFFHQSVTSKRRIIHLNLKSKEVITKNSKKLQKISILRNKSDLIYGDVIPLRRSNPLWMCNHTCNFKFCLMTFFCVKFVLPTDDSIITFILTYKGNG